MAGRRKQVLDIREMVRRIRAGESSRRIAQDLEVSRNTVKKYRRWAAEKGCLEKEKLVSPLTIEESLKSEENAEFRGPVSTVEKYRDFVKEKRKEGVEIKALLGLLCERGYEGSYSSLRRFVSRLEPRKPEATVRVETPPGQEAQVDFGYAGKLYDSVTRRFRKAWVFVMTLCFGRH
jgi:transposase